MNDDEFAELFKRLTSQPSGGTTWQDVGNEFGALGKTWATCCELPGSVRKTTRHLSACASRCN